ncbi:Zn(II)2Cys6 transcription factor domain-containing protein [Aspergillus saccharolyticus JOP 1030-1]|uniref:Zn(2)-C6 fungal-type domain-containing protein n=1 Tax=Aspergillus saccharolyticus JOP 1030-1 TaxID=1450539 RepID=A0A318ZZU3_9EURO|nr:hypothetical protein BP01DRAFT_44310 [Aspergillus saccharolyticus JOP 1030-1]PYH45588.1 hypothetical protein BP01DRAFT_44310 [Aspergillus saccharolyticus JOP 1030-1]
MDNSVSLGGSSARPGGACERCRRLKIKCERGGDKHPCLSCRERDCECLPATNKARHRISTRGRSNHLTSMEARIARIESVLGNHPLDVETQSRAQSLANTIKEQASLDGMSSLRLFDDDGETHFIGPWARAQA